MAGHQDGIQIYPRAYQLSTPPPPCLFEQITRKTVFWRILDRRYLPSQRCTVLESCRQLSGDPLCHEGGESGMDHNNTHIIVISFFV